MEVYFPKLEIPEKILKDDSVEILHNFCKQKMKPVKQLLKNSMNIGSETTITNLSFIFSLIESYKL